MLFVSLITASLLNFSPVAAAKSAATGSVEVLQATAVFGRDKGLRYLQAGVSTCVVVAIFDPDTQTTYFAHIDAGVDVPSAIRSAIEKFKNLKIKPSKLRAYIAGGWEGWSNQQSDQARKSLQQLGVRVVAYEPPLDIGYTIEDDRNLRLPPASARGRAIRSYRFDLVTQRLTLIPTGQQQSVAQSFNPSGLAAEPLPLATKPNTSSVTPPPTQKINPAAR